MDWQTFTISVFGSSVIAALVTAVVNGLMNYKTKIRAIKESGLYAKRADVLDELMKRMERLDRIMEELISFVQYKTTDEAENERRKKASDAFNYFVGYYKRNRHYLPKQLSDEIAALCSEYKDLFVGFSYEARIQGERPNIKKWQELIKKHQGELVGKRERVAEEFRKIIGVK